MFHYQPRERRREYVNKSAAAIDWAKEKQALTTKKNSIAECIELKIPT